MREKLGWTMMAMCLLPMIGFAQVPLRTVNDVGYGIAARVPFDPEEKANSIIIFEPAKDFSLHIPQALDTTLNGRVVEVLKGVMPGKIIMPADSFTTDVKADVPVKMFLMEHPEKIDVYYPIAIYSVKEGGQ